MARECRLSGKKGLVGNHVSHSNRKTKRVQRPNLLKKRLFIPEQNRTVTIRISARALRNLDRKSLHQILTEQGIRM